MWRLPEVFPGMAWWALLLHKRHRNASRTLHVEGILRNKIPHAWASDLLHLRWESDVDGVRGVVPVYARVMVIGSHRSADVVFGVESLDRRCHWVHLAVVDLIHRAVVLSVHRELRSIWLGLQLEMRCGRGRQALKPVAIIAHGCRARLAMLAMLVRLARRSHIRMIEILAPCMRRVARMWTSYKGSRELLRVGLPVLRARHKGVLRCHGLRWPWRWPVHWQHRERAIWGGQVSWGIRRGLLQLLSKVVSGSRVRGEVVGDVWVARLGTRGSSGSASATQTFQSTLKRFFLLLVHFFVHDNLVGDTKVFFKSLVVDF